MDENSYRESERVRPEDAFPPAPDISERVSSNFCATIVRGRSEEGDTSLLRGGEQPGQRRDLDLWAVVLGSGTRIANYGS